MEAPSRRVSFGLTAEEHARLKDHARSEFRSVEAQLRKIVTEYLDAQDRVEVVDHRVAA